MRIRRVFTLGAAAVTGLVIGAMVVGRQGSSHLPLLPGPARRHALTEAKLRVVLPAVRFRAAPLEKALDELGQRTGATFVVDWEALEAGGVYRDDVVDLDLSRVTLQQALDAVVGYAGGGRHERVLYTLFEGAVVITTESHAGRYAYASVYDLRDIDTGPLPPFDPYSQAKMPVTRDLFGESVERAPTRAEMDETLTHLIQETVAPDSWIDAGGSCGTVQTFGGRAVVITTWQNHRQIQDLVSQVRNPSR